jgi:MoaA/NifB/PqqE/SkfB family radical SAM enzyme
MSYFCYFPFIHANIRANKNRQVAPCWRSDEILGNLDDSTLEEIWNGEAYNELRKKFLRGEKPEGCARCWKLEENDKTANLSLRDWGLQNYTKYKDIINNPELKSIELRFSNLCNFSCLHCGSQHSTTWNNKLKKFKGLEKFQDITDKNPRIITENEVDDMITLFSTIDEVRITGGEPLTDPVFYYFLKKMPADIAKKITLIIVSNLSTLKYEEKDAIPLFEKFKEVKLRVSIDADEETYSYFRSGGNINVIKTNISRIQSYTNNVNISGVCAVNILNITRLGNIITFHEDRNMSLKFIFVQERPPFLDIRNLPKIVKNEIQKADITYFSNHNQKEFKRVLNFMNSSKGDLNHWNDLKKYLEQIDKMNNTNFLQTYKEFTPWWKLEN